MKIDTSDSEIESSLDGGQLRHLKKQLQERRESIISGTGAHREISLICVTQGRNKGDEWVKVYRFDSDSGILTETDTYKALQYSEPRHVSIHPNNKYVYLINEKGNCITFFEFDSRKGKLYPRQILLLLPETYTDRIIPTEIPVCITFLQEA